MYIHQRIVRVPLTALVAASLVALSACGGNDNEVGASAASSPAVSALPKNVIVMISDGASSHTWDMASSWEKGVKANELDAYKTMSVRLGMTTFPLTMSNTMTNTTATSLGYDATKAWSATPITGMVEPDPALASLYKVEYQNAFEGYRYLRNTYTDSAAAGTALASGVKSYNNAINYDNLGKPVQYVTQIAKAQGKATGVVTSVPYSHATPAAFGAQNVSRNNLAAITKSMLEEGVLDLIMGAAHPDFDDNGRSFTATDPTCASTACQRRYAYIAQGDWENLKAGSVKPKGASANWKLIQTKSDFDALAAGTLTYNGPIFGVPQVATTLQQGRTLAVKGADSRQPSGIMTNANVPTLETMTKGALQSLSKNGKGLFLMVEGGAVDWAAHANQAGHIIEEQVEFNHAVAAVKKWVETNSNWNETLLTITTDHGNGMPMGTQSASKAYDPVLIGSAGAVPEVKWWTPMHTNELVRLWAHGAGSETLLRHVREKDAGFVKHVGHNSDGAYIDNTDVFKTIKALLQK